MILLTIADLAVLILWIVLTNRLCFRLYPPRKLVVIYGDRNAAELVLKMSRRVDKYMICESVSANAPPEEIQEQLHGTRVLSSVRFRKAAERSYQILLRPECAGVYCPKFRNII